MLMHVKKQIIQKKYARRAIISLFYIVTD